jgi:oxaloacetate decarboxylase beta subunit
MGLGMIFVNTAQFFLPPYPPFPSMYGNPHLAPLVGSDITNPVMAATEQMIASTLFWLQPVYAFTFLNGAIACFVFIGIGAMTDLDFLIAKPFTSFFLAAFAELGTLLTFPLAVAFGFPYNEAASIAIIGGADGPMVLYTSLKLAPKLFVPITVVAYLYLSILYLFQGKLDELSIPRKMRAVPMAPTDIRRVSTREKILFDIIAGAILSLLFPVASPLIASFFIGNILKEANIDRLRKFADEILLNGSTFFLGLMLGILVTPDVILDPKVVNLLILGITALVLSSLGGSLGGILMYYISKGKINALLGPAGVSCVPTTAKISQKEAQKINKRNYIIYHAMGPNVAGVITTAILSAIYMTIVPLL